MVHRPSLVPPTLPFHQGKLLLNIRGHAQNIRGSELTDTPPQLPAASYRYNTTSGAVFVVDDTIGQPNGIAFNPDASVVYISDTGTLCTPCYSGIDSDDLTLEYRRRERAG